MVEEALKHIENTKIKELSTKIPTVYPRALVLLSESPANLRLHLHNETASTAINKFLSTNMKQYLVLNNQENFQDVVCK